MRLPILFAVLAGCSLAGLAAGSQDPFSTEAMMPLKPSPALAGRVTEAPCATVLPATPLGVVDVVDLALCNNPQTREAWANARLQAAQLGVAKSGWLPSLDGRLTANRTWGEETGFNQRTVALTLSWLLFDFGARSAGVESARQLLLAASATQDATIQTVFLSALQAYYGAQAGHAAVDAARQAEKAAGESYAAADTRYRIGVATPADRLQARTAWSQGTLNRIRAEGDARNALGALANVMGFDAQQPLNLAELPALVPDAAFEQDVAVLVDQARRLRPDLRAAEALVKSARAGADAARAGGLPTFSLAAGPSWQEIGGVSTQGGLLGVTVAVPLFSGFNTTYKIRAAEAQTEVRSAQRQRIDKQIALDVWRAYQSLTTASQSLKTTADLVAGAEESERVALGRYKAGVGSILDVLNAQSALAAARQQRIQATLDWNVFRAALAQAMGALDYGLLQPAVEGKQ